MFFAVVYSDYNQIITEAINIQSNSTSYKSYLQ